MKIIRDTEFYSMSMVALLIEWQIFRCNVQGCRNRPTTIIRLTATESPEGEPTLLGMCEEHYQEFSKAGRIKCRMSFEPYNAFKEQGDDS